MRRKGLCPHCYLDEGVRGMYECLRPTSPESAVPLTRLRKPAEPTQALPGTEAKVKVMEERAARGELLWHALDARLPEGDEEEESWPCGRHLVRSPAAGG